MSGLKSVGAGLTALLLTAVMLAGCSTFGDGGDIAANAQPQAAPITDSSVTSSSLPHHRPRPVHLQLGAVLPGKAARPGKPRNEAAIDRFAGDLKGGQSELARRRQPAAEGLDHRA